MIPGVSTGGGGFSNSSSAAATGKSGNISRGNTSFNYGAPVINKQTILPYVIGGMVAAYFIYKKVK